MRRLHKEKYRSSSGISKKLISLLFLTPLLIGILLAYNYDLFGVTGDIPVPLSETGFLTPASEIFETVKKMHIDDRFLAPDEFDDEELLYRLASQARQDYGAQTDNEVPEYLAYSGLDLDELFNQYNKNFFKYDENQEALDFLVSIEDIDVSERTNFMEMMNLFGSNSTTQVTTLVDNIAIEVEGTLQAVPEPSVFILSLSGFCFLRKFVMASNVNGKD